MTTPPDAAEQWQFRLGHWPVADRRALAGRLQQTTVAHEWVDADLYVDADRRDQVESIIAHLSDRSRGFTAAAAAWAASSPAAPAYPDAVEVAAALDAAFLPPPPPVVVLPPPGWYPDPWGLTPARWWDGAAWTGYVAAAAVPERGWIPPRHTREGALRGGLIALLGFVGAIVLSLLGALIVLPFGGSVHSLEALCLSQAGLWLSLIVACKVAVVRHGSGSLRDLGLARLSWRQVGLGALVGIVMRFVGGALAVAIAQLFPGEQWKHSAAPGTSFDRNALSIAVLTFILVVGAPFFEELFFRGLVQGAFTARTGARFAVLAQAVCFGAVHYHLGMSLAQTTVTVVTIGVTGAVLGALRWHAEKLGPGMAAHAVFNAVAALVLFTI